MEIVDSEEYIAKLLPFLSPSAAAVGRWPVASCRYGPRAASAPASHTAIANVTLNVIAGFLATWLGIGLARLL